MSEKRMRICLICLLQILMLFKFIKTARAGSGTIYLYGENHGVEWILQEEIELWRDHYTNKNMRHLFIEQPHYTAALLNIWLRSDSDEILDQLYADWAGTAAQNPHSRQFFKTIKSEFPETVFHGTDVGHQYQTTGKRYLDYLQANGLGESEEYQLTKEIIAQGHHWYEFREWAYRENKMVENFVREFSKLAGESVMAIYGAAHTDPDAMNYPTGTVPSIAAQLGQRYDNLVIKNLTLQTDPARKTEVKIGDMVYEATFLAKVDRTGLSSFAHFEFWRLEDAYHDLKSRPKTGDWLPYNNYPVLVEEGQVYKIDAAMVDGTRMTLFYRSDGALQNNLPVMEGFVGE